MLRKFYGTFFFYDKKDSVKFYRTSPKMENYFWFFRLATKSICILKIKLRNNLSRFFLLTLNKKANRQFLSKTLQYQESLDAGPRESFSRLFGLKFSEDVGNIAFDDDDVLHRRSATTTSDSSSSSMWDPSSKSGGSFGCG